jgi:hypothetical protein
MLTKLPIDLIAISTNKVEETIAALNFSSNRLSFENIFLFTDKYIKGNFECVLIPKLKDIIEYNNVILDLNKFIKSDFALVIQHDGHILNPDNWSNEFLNYDYIGAPWPNSKEWNMRWKNYPDEISSKIFKNISQNRIGNGGFSLRSKKFLEYSSQFEKNFLKHGVPEDIFLNVVNYDLSQEFKINYPSVGTAIKFSYETPLKGSDYSKLKRYHIFDIKKHLGWHGNRFLNSKKLNKIKFNT